MTPESKVDELVERLRAHAAQARLQKQPALAQLFDDSAARIQADAERIAGLLYGLQHNADLVRDLRRELAEQRRDAERLDALEAAGRRGGWADCFSTDKLDDGSWWVRPWRYRNQSMKHPGGRPMFKDNVVAQTLRETIDAALAAQGERET